MCRKNHVLANAAQGRIISLARSAAADVCSQDREELETWVCSEDRPAWSNAPVIQAAYHSGLLQQDQSLIHFQLACMLRPGRFSTFASLLAELVITTPEFQAGQYLVPIASC